MTNFQVNHPLKHAVAEFELADQAYKRMLEISVGSFQSYEIAWRDFLRRIERVYAKTRSASMHKSGWQKINSEISSTRKNDPLLQYLQQARNADEHSIQDVASDWDAQLTATPTEGGIRLNWKHWDRPLLPITNRGVTYIPARHHLGTSYEHLLGKGKAEPVIVAEFALQFYCDFINRVSTELFSSIK